VPQLATRPKEAKKLISASMPPNISAEDKKKLEDDWNEKARLRAEAVARETSISTEPSKILKYELHKFGRHWMSYARRNGKLVPLLNGPSLFTSAVEAMDEAVADEVTRA
jgi:hypothetical protein